MIHLRVETGTKEFQRDLVDKTTFGALGQEDTRHAAAPDLANEPVRANAASFDRLHRPAITDLLNRGGRGGGGWLC
jgi:hypothetical protein